MLCKSKTPLLNPRLKDLRVVYGQKVKSQHIDLKFPKVVKQWKKAILQDTKKGMRRYLMLPKIETEGSNHHQASKYEPATAHFQDFSDYHVKNFNSIGLLRHNSVVLCNPSNNSLQIPQINHHYTIISMSVEGLECHKLTSG